MFPKLNNTQDVKDMLQHTGTRHFMDYRNSTNWDYPAKTGTLSTTAVKEITTANSTITVHTLITLIQVPGGISAGKYAITLETDCKLRAIPFKINWGGTGFFLKNREGSPAIKKTGGSDRN